MIYLYELGTNYRKQTAYALIEDHSDNVEYKIFKKSFTTTEKVENKFGTRTKLNDEQKQVINSETYAIYDNSLQFLRRNEIEYTIVQSLDELPQIEKEPCMWMCEPCQDGRNFACENTQ